MSNDGPLGRVRVGPGSAGLRAVLRRLPAGGPEQQAVEAGEVDAVIDYGNANVIMFPAARSALRVAALRASAPSRKATPDASAANAMLDALPRAEYQRLLPDLEPVALKFGEVLHEPGAPIRHVYFPVDCVICLLTRASGQCFVETGLVGYEGAVGISLAFGVDASSVRAIVQTAGTALRIPAAPLNRALFGCLNLQRVLFRFAHAKLAQARQTAACFASHLIEQRIACLFLMTSDRSRSREFFLTQEYLASILNVRRESVTASSASLRSRNLISYHRGRIEILDRKGLEAASCSCYKAMSAPYAT